MSSKITCTNSTEFIVTFKCYEYNSGMANSGTRTFKESLPSYEKAKERKEYIQSLMEWHEYACSTDKNAVKPVDLSEEHRIFVEYYLDYDGYVSYVSPDIFKVVTNKEVTKMEESLV